MYTVYVDNKPIHNPALNDKRYVIENPKLVEEANKAASFTFTIYPGNAYYNDIERFISVITVYEDDVLIFKGRTLNDTVGWFNQKTITCESDLAMMCDSIVRPYEFTGSVEEYLEMLIEQHNGQVEQEKQFTLRTVTVEDPNDTIVRANENYPDTFSEIREKLIDSLGGYLFVEYEEGVNYIDYLADSPYASMQPIKLGINLLDYSEEKRGEEIATVLIPLGAKNEDSGERIDIKTVNDGIDYIEDEDAIEEYGRIVKVEIWDDVTLPENLLTKGTARLSELSRGYTTIKLKAADLAGLQQEDGDPGERMSSFKVLQYVEIEDEFHRITGDMLIMSKTTDLTNSANNAISIGRESEGITRQTEDAAGKVSRVIADYVLNKQIRKLKSDIEENSSKIIQTESDILSEVASKYVTSDGYTQKVTELTSSIEQTAGAVVESYNELNTMIDEAGGALDAYKEEMQTIIRRDANGITIGRADSEFKTVLSNSKLSFIQGNNEVAYISDHKLYITEANITDRLVLGHFQWIVEADGSLSFVYVEGAANG